MFTESTAILGVACSDCVMMTANLDRSEMPDHWSFENWFLTNAYNFVEIRDEVHDFSTKRCDICLTTLAGMRQDIAMWEYPEDN